MMVTYTETSKAPRWVSTAAGAWAWRALAVWRDQAAQALTVQERSQLLSEAERLWRESAAAPSRYSAEHDD